MPALGSYRSGTILFLGLGTGLGSALIADGHIVPLELGHLPGKDGTYKTYLGLKGLDRLGITKWRQGVHHVLVTFISAFELDDVVVGGGNAAGFCSGSKTAAVDAAPARRLRRRQCENSEGGLDAGRRLRTVL